MDVLEQSGRLTDPGIVMDTFVSGLGEVEDLGGGCFRFTFYAKRKEPGGGEELIVVAKLIAPMEVVPPAIVMAARAIGLAVVFGGFFPRTDVN